MRTRIPRITLERAAQRRLYRIRVKRYLAEHPFDQIEIALLGLNEAKLIEAAGCYRDANGTSRRIARSTQIHHRNKADHTRLLDERWWLATNATSHYRVENNKDWARELGLLFPFQADRDGCWGDGNQALETPAFMASMVKGAAEVEP